MQRTTKIELQYLAAKTLGWTTKRKNQVRILTYHSISYRPDRTRHTPPELLEEHMKFLTSAGYKSFRICDIVHNWPEILDAAPAVIITFDDGLYNNKEFAYPLLRKYNMLATFFVPTAYIKDGRMPSHAEEMKPYDDIELMSWQDLRDLIQEGFEIGAHSHSHVMVGQQDYERVLSEVELPKKILEEKLNKPIYSFAYPKGQYGSSSAWTRELLARSGYIAGCTMFEERLNKNTDLLELPRIDITGTDNIRRFQIKLEGYYDCLKYLRQMRKICF